MFTTHPGARGATTETTVADAPLPAVLETAIVEHLDGVDGIDTVDGLVTVVATDPQRHAHLTGTHLGYAVAAGIAAAAGLIDPLPVPDPNANVDPRDVAHHVLAAYAALTPVSGTRYADGFAVIYADTPRHPLHSWVQARDAQTLRATLRTAAANT